MNPEDQPKRYSRSARIKGLPQPGEDTAETTTDAPRVVEHAKKGFTALHKVIALISTCLSVIVASITINNNLNKDKAATTPSTETRVTHIYKTETTVVSGSQSHPSETQGHQATSRTEAGSAQVTQQAPATPQSQTPASSAAPSTSSSTAQSQTASSTTSSTSSSSEVSNSSTTASTQSSATQNESATMTGSSEVVGTNGSGSE